MSSRRLEGRWQALVALGVLGLLQPACERTAEQLPEGESVASRRALAWAPGDAGASRRAIGEDCSVGESACVSSMCVHVSEWPDRGYFCTSACEQSENCPSGWSCAEMIPGQAATRLCVPPAQWTTRAVTVARPFTRTWARQVSDVDPSWTASRDRGVLVQVDGGLP